MFNVIRVKRFMSDANFFGFDELENNINYLVSQYFECLRQVLPILYAVGKERIFRNFNSYPNRLYCTC